MSDSVQQLLAQVLEHAKRTQRRRNSEASNQVKLSCEKTGQLPLWPESVRDVPNGLLRSALFGVANSRHYLERERLAAPDGIEIFYTGQRLDQDDLETYENVLHVARLHKIGESCRVSSYALLKLSGLSDSGKNRGTLVERLTRLRANAVEIRQGQHIYIGGLLDQAYKDEKTRGWIIALNPKLGSLFAPDQFTRIEWGIRHALKRKPLAQWLYGFYASHARPYPIKVETLRKLSGSETKRLDHFRENLRKALDAISRTCGSFGEEFCYTICVDRDLVHVTKAASASQRRHLAKKFTAAETKARRRFDINS
ncbi:plasmid replication initiator TrfA [Paludibacterium sp. B53371]|uniref:plasmid replication initiator TrfA n=1 Tax=Paludibacterium sp. B53371 TaxID=2806263 RepID=UPI001C05E15F|nr:plasmid replication initiator TrfA [Paludibacterium sp. B53371]